MWEIKLLIDDKGLECGLVLKEVEEVAGAEIVGFVVADVLDVLDEAVLPLTVSVPSAV